MTTTIVDKKCVLKLYTTGSSDVLAWYDIWEAVEATFAVCGRQRKGGIHRGLGWFSRIVVD